MTHITKITSYYFRLKAAYHNERFGRELTWGDARLLYREAQQDAQTHAKNNGGTVDVAWVSEYGLTQKLSNSIRCF